MEQSGAESEGFDDEDDISGIYESPARTGAGAAAAAAAQGGGNALNALHTDLAKLDAEIAVLQRGILDATRRHQSP